MQDISSRLTHAFLLCNEYDTAKRQLGENELRNLAMEPQYPIFILQYILNPIPGISSECIIRAAIEFKKWVVNSWTSQNIQDIQYSEIHTEVKKEIVKVLMSVNSKVSKFIVEAILTIAKLDFPKGWPNLPLNLMSFLNINQVDDERNCLIFKVLSKIMARYEYSSRSDPLWEEIILVGDTTLDYILQFAVELTKIITSQTTFGSLHVMKYVLRCFYLLNCQDMPIKVEENLKIWFQILSQILVLKPSAGIDKKFEILFFKCKGEALKSVLLYSTKYREEFEPLIKDFSEEIWKVCTNIKDNEVYDEFLQNAMKYFKNLLYWNELKDFFSTNIETLMSTLLFRNMKPTKEDVELFEDEPQAFIEATFNNAAASSKRSIAMELAKALGQNYTQQCIPVLQSLLAKYVEQYKSGQLNIESEIILMNMLIQMGVKAFRPKEGVKQICLPDEFYTYFYTNIVEPSLYQVFQVAINDVNFVPENTSLNLFHIAHLIRFVFYFRQWIDKTKILDIAKSLSYLLKTKTKCFRMIIFYTIDALITLREQIQGTNATQPIFNKFNAIEPLQHILQNTYICLKGLDEVDTYGLKALCSMITILQDGCIQFSDAFSDLFKHLIIKLYKGYDFQHIHLVFEGLASLTLNCIADVKSMQSIYTNIHPELNNIIKKNHNDMIGYVFQIYALSLRSADQISQNYRTLFDSLLNKANWAPEMISMYPAYCFYLEEYLSKDISPLGHNAVEFQTILQILIDSKLDNLFFSFCNKIVSMVDLKSLRSIGWLAILLNLLLKPLHFALTQTHNKENTKSVIRMNFARGLLQFFSLCIIKFGFPEFILDIESVFGTNITLFYNFYVTQINFISNYQVQPERKLILYGVTNMVFNPAFEKIPQDLWKSLLNAVLENFTKRKTSKSNIYFLKEDDDDGASGVISGNKSSFQRLSFLNQKIDYLKDMLDEEKNFALKLHDQFPDPHALQNFIFQFISPQYQVLTSIAPTICLHSLI